MKVYKSVCLLLFVGVRNQPTVTNTDGWSCKVGPKRFVVTLFTPTAGRSRSCFHQVRWINQQGPGPLVLSVAHTVNWNCLVGLRLMWIPTDHRNIGLPPGRQKQVCMYTNAQMLRCSVYRAWMDCIGYTYSCILLFLCLIFGPKLLPSAGFLWWLTVVR